MAQIGSLEFTISAVDESSSTIDSIAKKIQDMGSAMSSAESMTDQQMQRIAKDIQEAYAGLDTASMTHRESLAGLQKTYEDLGKAMGEAFRQGSAEGDEIYRKAQMQRQAVSAQILEEKKLGKEIDSTAEELAKVADAFEQKAKAVKQSESAQASLRSQMRLVVQQLAEQEEAARASGGEVAVQALRASREYQALQQEAGRLSNAMGDAQAQMRIFANDNAGLQGVIVGLQGMTGTMSAAQGVIGMFTSDQKELQQVMLKVQSVMAIANGMMQVSNALNKDSYFTLVVLNRVKQAWAETNKKALASQEAETATLTANTAATEANAAAETQGTAAKAAGVKGWVASRLAAAEDTKAKFANVIATKAASTANKGLALSFRLVATAIKSIPVIGWVLTGLAAVAGSISLITKASREAKKEQEELKEKITEAGAESVASLTKLSSQFIELGDNMREKQKFIEDNKAEFEKLGISVQSVVDAEEVLIKNKEKFVKAQIAKAAASVLYDKLKDKAKELVEAEQEYYDKQTSKRQGAVQDIEEEMEQIIGQINNKTEEASTLMGRFATQAGDRVKETAKKTAEGAAESITTINRLSAQWQALNGDIKAQRKFIADNKGEFERLGISIKSATDAENALVANKDKFIAAMQAKAESMAYFDIAKEKYKEYIEASMEMEALLESTRVSGKVTEETKQRLTALQAKMKETSKQAEQLIAKGNKKAEEAAKLSPQQVVSTATKEDKFLKEINERKKEYERYAKFIRSTNANLQAAVQGDEFKKLLEGGKTYKEYIENQMKALQQAGEKTKGYAEHLRALQDELASLEQQTVIDEFKKALDKQLEAAKTQQEFLDIIAAQREQLKEGGDIEVNLEKTQILDETEQKFAEREKQQTQQLLNQYADYLAKKVQFEADYAENSRRLNKAIAEAKTEDERQVAIAALRQLERQKERYQNDTSTGDTEYDAMLAEFKNFEQQKTQIEQDYQEKINIAIQHNNQQLAEDLRARMKEELGELAAAEVKSSDAFKQLFEGTQDIDKMATDQIEQLIKQINTDLELHPEIDPKSAKEITDKLQGALNVVASRKPFASLKKEWQDFVDGIKKGDIAGTIDELGGTLGNIADVLNSAISGLSELGLLNEQSEQTLTNIEGMVSGAADMAQGIATGNYLQAIQGGIQLAVNAVKQFNTTYQKMVSLAKEHEKVMEKWQKTYKKLSDTVSNSTGQALTEAQQELAKSLEKQILIIKREIETLQHYLATTTSRGKKEEYQRQIEELRAELEDLQDKRDELYTDIAERAMGGTSINSAMEELVSALVDTWAQGGNAVDAYHKKVKDIVKDITRNMIVQQLITDQLKRYFDETFTSDWINLSPEEQEARIQQLMQNVDAYGDQLMNMMDGFSDEMKEWLSWGEESSGLSGAIQSMSQESADLLAGQTNAIRLNQATMIDLIREQLIQLSGINTGVAAAANTLSSIEVFMRRQRNANYNARAIGVAQINRLN